MSDGLSSWQRIYRFLWRFMGPAQTGLPPYATAEEREEYQRRNQPRPPAVSEAPPGYRFLVYTDPNGVPRRALIPIDPTAAGEGPAATDLPTATEVPTATDARAATTAPVAPDAREGGTTR